VSKPLARQETEFVHPKRMMMESAKSIISREVPAKQEQPGRRSSPGHQQRDQADA
jgi:hypothetical protein